jgi:hypothetical protein
VFHSSPRAGCTVESVVSSYSLTVAIRQQYKQPDRQSKIGALLHRQGLLLYAGSCGGLIVTDLLELLKLDT